MARMRLKDVRVEGGRCTCAHCGHPITQGNGPCIGMSRGCMHPGCAAQVRNGVKQEQAEHAGAVHASRSAAARAAATKRVRQGFCGACGFDLGRVDRKPRRCPMCRTIGIPEGAGNAQPTTQQ